MDMIHFRCPKCNDQLSVPESLGGSAEECPNCGNVTIVPQAVAGTPLNTTSGPPSPRQTKPSGKGRLIWTGIPSWKAYVGHYIFAVISVIAGFGFLATKGNEMTGTIVLLTGALFALAVELSRRSTRYRITDQMIWRKTGILSLNTTEIPVAHLREVKLTQGILDRMFGVGKIAFSTSASSGYEIVWHGVENPTRVRDLARKLVW